MHRTPHQSQINRANKFVDYLLVDYFSLIIDYRQDKVHSGNR